KISCHWKRRTKCNSNRENKKCKAEYEGVNVFNIPDFLLACKNIKLLSKKDIEEIIKDLKEKDYYEFKQNIKTRVLAIVMSRLVGCAVAQTSHENILVVAVYD
ncbi:MAG: hypothetical protein ACE5KE_15350, partial [Methanosarcinales archaeon]